jgi:hypothetical protein
VVFFFLFAATSTPHRCLSYPRAVCFHYSPMSRLSGVFEATIPARTSLSLVGSSFSFSFPFLLLPSSSLSSAHRYLCILQISEFEARWSEVDTTRCDTNMDVDVDPVILQHGEITEYCHQNNTERVSPLSAKSDYTFRLFVIYLHLFSSLSHPHPPPSSQ